MALRVRPCLVCTGFLFNATPAEVPVPVPRAVQREVVVDRHIPVPQPMPVMQQPVMQMPTMPMTMHQPTMLTTAHWADHLQVKGGCAALCPLAAEASCWRCRRLGVPAKITRTSTCNGRLRFQPSFHARELYGRVLASTGIVEK